MNSNSTQILLNIKNSLKKSHTVMWEKERQDRYLTVPKKNLFGAEIYSIKDNHESICKDISPTEIVKYSSDISLDKNTIALKLYNGTFIRMYHYDGKWWFATNGAVFAKKAVWKSTKNMNINKIDIPNNKSFYTLFFNALSEKSTNKKYKTLLEEYKDTLDKAQTHIFLLYDPSIINVIPFGCKSVCERILSISHKESNKLEYINEKYEIHPSKEKDVLKDFYENNKSYSSLLLMGKKNKIFFTKNYSDKLKIVSNIPSLKYIILKNLNNKKELIKHYPFWEPLYDAMVLMLKTTFCEDILDVYFQVFKKKNKKFIRNKFMGICNVIHEHFLSTKETITQEVIYDIITHKIHHGIIAKLCGIKIQ